MAKDKIYLGKTKQDFPHYGGENMWIEKHSWDCGWYWGFGYIGNRNLHCHFDGLIHHQLCDVNDVFSDTKITGRDWWILRDLFVQAYALKKVAEVYRHGGHQTTDQYDTTMIQSSSKADAINADLKIILDKIWEILTDISNGERVQPVPNYNSTAADVFVCQEPEPCQAMHPDKCPV